MIIIEEASNLRAKTQKNISLFTEIYKLNPEDLYHKELEEKLKQVNKKINIALNINNLKTQLDAFLEANENLEEILGLAKEFQDDKRFEEIKIDSSLNAIHSGYLYLAYCISEVTKEDTVLVDIFIENIFEGIKIFSSVLTFRGYGLKYLDQKILASYTKNLKNIICKIQEIQNLGKFKGISSEQYFQVSQMIMLLHGCILYLEDSIVTNNFLENLIELLKFNHFEVNGDQKYIASNINLDEYEKISESLGDQSWCNISYFEGILELMSPSRNHEDIASFLRSIVEHYCYIKDIECYPFGSTRLKKIHISPIGKEPDGGYAFQTNKDFPDLAIEVNFTSGSILDLEKYKNLGIKELWMWDRKNNLTFFVLENSSYKAIEKSHFLPLVSNINVKEFVSLMKENGMNSGKHKITNFLS